MLSHWQAREQLTTKLAKTIERRRDFSAWEATRLELLDAMLHRCLRRPAIGSNEKEAYGTICRAAHAVVEPVRQRANANAMAALRDDLNIEKLCRLAGYRRSPKMDAPLEQATRRVHALLHVLPFLANDAAGRERCERIRDMLGPEATALWRAYLDESDTIGATSLHLRRRALARLLWAKHEIVRDVDEKGTIAATMNEWWPVLQAFSALPPVERVTGDGSVEHEANSLANLLRLSHDLTFESLRRANAWSGGVRRDADAVDGLNEYVREIVSARIDPLVETFLSDSSALQRGEETPLARQALISRLLLQYHALYVAPAAGKLKRVDRALRERARRPIELHEDDSVAPKSQRWRAYTEVCTSLRARLQAYVSTYETADKSKPPKPFVILVVGRPGTGKSQFIESVVEKALGSVEKVELNLSQANSVTGGLDVVWRTLHRRTRHGVGLLVLDEFDSQIGGETDQYRRVLGPLWDGRTQIAEPNGFADGVANVNLGSFVAICIMSKVETASEARRFLLEAEKGADFLSRTDVIVEVPHFDQPETQLELTLAMLWRAFSQKEPGQPAKIGELALRCLAWLPTTDNFRSLAKAVKTVPRKDGALRYDSLNLNEAARQQFIRALSECAHLSKHEIRRLLKNQVREPMITVRKEASSLTISEPTSLRELARGSRRRRSPAP